jgi:hypothetical protein
MLGKAHGCVLASINTCNVPQKAHLAFPYTVTLLDYLSATWERDIY